MLCSILGNFLFKYKKRTSRIFSLCVKRTRRVREKKGEEKKGEEKAAHTNRSALLADKTNSNKPRGEKNGSKAEK